MEYPPNSDVRAKQQMLAIARALAARPQLFILDEFTLGVADSNSQLYWAVALLKDTQFTFRRALPVFGVPRYGNDRKSRIPTPEF